MNFKPYRYQLEDVRAVHRMGGRALVAWEMGLGKTGMSLMYLNRHPGQRPAVVVCPASLKLNWAREAERFFGMRTTVLGGTRPGLGLATPAPVVVVNYDVLAPTRHGEGWLGWLKELKPQVVVIDECHYLGDPRTKRTKAVRELCRGVPHVLALSGTPLVNRPAELFPTLNILRPDLFPSFFPFAIRYAGARKSPWGWEFKGATNVGELNRVLTRHLMVRRRKEDVLKDLPAKRRSVIPVELSDRKEYDLAHEEFLTWIAMRKPDRMTAALLAERLVRLGYLKRLAGQLKLPAVLAWVDDFLSGSGEKLVLFAIHKPVIAEVRRRYEKVCVVVDGGTPNARRQEAVDAFQRSDKVRLFVGNVRAAGVGLTLTAASTMAFAEMGWTPGEHTQAEDRIHRIGQTGSALCHYFVAADTIETDLVEIIQSKQRVISSVLDGDERAAELNVLDLLVKKMTGGGP